MTIHDIKHYTSRKAPNYFSRNTLSYFGQHLSDFRVRKIKGRVFIMAPLVFDGEISGFTVREFIRDKDDIYNSDLSFVPGPKSNLLTYEDAIEHIKGVIS